MGNPQKQPHLTLYLDCVSPYAYMSFHSLISSPSLNTPRLSYTLVPIFLSGVMQTTGNRPPMAVAAKGTYSRLDLARLCRRYRITIGEPCVFPVNTLLAQRCLAVLQMENQDLVTAFKGLYEAYWVNGEDIGDPQVVEEIVGKEVVGKAGLQEAKDKLAGNTSEVVENGCFGMPWWTVEFPDGKKESWWGFDRMEEVLGEMGVEWKEGRQAKERCLAQEGRERL